MRNCSNDLDVTSLNSASSPSGTYVLFQSWCAGVTRLEEDASPARKAKCPHLRKRTIAATLVAAYKRMATWVAILSRPDRYKKPLPENSGDVALIPMVSIARY